MIKKSAWFFLVCILLLSVSSLAAVEARVHIIAGYSFEITGKTKASAVERRIVPVGGDPPFFSVSQMENALENKRAQLYNMRIFEEVSYSYTLLKVDETAYYYQVTFFIDDAFTFLPIPYPKYDSNYGLRVGLKAYDKNLFGTFSDLFFVINATQADFSWDRYNWFSELTIQDIPIGKSTLDLGATFSATQEGKVWEDIVYTGAIDWTGISVAKMTLGLHAALDDDSLTTSFQLADIPIVDNRTLMVKPTFEFSYEEYEEDEQRWDLSELQFESAIAPLYINGDPYRLSNTLAIKSQVGPIQSTTKLSLIGQKFLGLPFSFWLSAENWLNLQQAAWYNNTYAVGFSSFLPLPLSVRYDFSYEASLAFDTQTDIEKIPVLSTVQSISFGQVNWKDNMRQGSRALLRFSGDYALFENEWDPVNNLSYTAQGELVMFLPFSDTFGLSARAMGYYAHVPSWTWYAEDEQHFPAFLPTNEIFAPELLRGILDKSFEEAVGSGDYRKIGSVFNIDATFLFLKIGSFAETFLSAFFDMGLFTHSDDMNNTISWEDITIFKTVGIEGYGIMDKFPSYPIRASFGCNLDHLVEHVKGERDFTDISYELTIGMGLHY